MKNKYGSFVGFGKKIMTGSAAVLVAASALCLPMVSSAATSTVAVVPSTMAIPASVSLVAPGKAGAQTVQVSFPKNISGWSATVPAPFIVSPSSGFGASTVLTVFVPFNTAQSATGAIAITPIGGAQKMIPVSFSAPAVTVTPGTVKVSTSGKKGLQTVQVSFPSSVSSWSATVPAPFFVLPLGGIGTSTTLTVGVLGATSTTSGVITITAIGGAQKMIPVSFVPGH